MNVLEYVAVDERRVAVGLGPVLAQLVRVPVDSSCPISHAWRSAALSSYFRSPLRQR